MGILADIYIKAETLKILADTVAKKGDKGISLTISISDEADKFGQNVSQFVSQSKEDREAKKTKFYAGNGRVFWTDNKPALVPKKDQEYAKEPEEGVLPF